MKNYVLEIKNSEGGEDSKLLVDDMYNIYQKVMQKNNFAYKIVSKRFGFISIWLTSKESFDFFTHETGGHRWQRIPPTEHKGRVHTSTILVSLLENSTPFFNLNKNDVRVIFSKGSGPGGQNKNKVVTCVELRHEPTGISVRIDGRSRINNEKIAWDELEKRLNDLSVRDNNHKLANIKRE